MIRRGLWQPLLLQLSKRQGRSRIARDQDQRAALREQPLDGRLGQSRDFLRGSSAVGRICVVAQIDKVLLRHRTAQLGQHREPAKARVNTPIGCRVALILSQ